MAKFIEVYVSATGAKQRVPESWMDHPVLSKGLRVTPLTRKERAKKGLHEAPPVESIETPADAPDQVE